MNDQATHHSGLSKTHLTPAPHPLTDLGAQAATETIYKVAQFARTLKYVARVVEKLARPASGTNEHLTLLHWLVLVRLSSTPMCRQMDLKSDTNIAAAYLTRLLDDLIREGMVRRHRSSFDRRQILLSLTERGKGSAHELLVSLNDVMRSPKLNAIEHLSASLEQFVSLAGGEEWPGKQA